LVDQRAQLFEQAATPSAGFYDDLVKVVDLLADMRFGFQEALKAGIGAAALAPDGQQVAAVDVGNG
jgi:hypothetical protein